MRHRQDSAPLSFDAPSLAVCCFVQAKLAQLMVADGDAPWGYPHLGLGLEAELT